MSLLRPVSIFIRNALVKQHPYFSCCASCGEIRTPLGNRLCTSLSPHFPVDAFLTSAVEQPVQAAQELIHRLPWLRTVYHPGLRTGEERLSAYDPESLASGAKAFSLPPEAFFHTLPGMAEHCLIVNSPGLGESHTLDFFTPNGIPLIDLARLPEGAAEDLMRGGQEEAFRCLSGQDRPLPVAPPVYAMTAALAASLLEQLATVSNAPVPDGRDKTEWFAFLAAGWAFASGQGILSPTRNPLA